MICGPPCLWRGRILSVGSPVKRRQSGESQVTCVDQLLSKIRLIWFLLERPGIQSTHDHINIAGSVKHNVKLTPSTCGDEVRDGTAGNTHLCVSTPLISILHVYISWVHWNQFHGISPVVLDVSCDWESCYYTPRL